MTATETVSGLMEAWKTLDIDNIMGFFADDAVYTNIPMEPANSGKAEIRAFIEGFLGMVTAIEFVVHHQLEGANGVVMNERTDKLCLDGKKVDLPVMGVFEVRDGQIIAWRDYFDMKQFTG